MKTRTAGFVYVLTNPAMPGIVKIGFTTKLAEDRAADLSNTSVPYPFETVFRCRVMNPRQVEATAHQRLHADRVTANREFFHVAADAATDAVIAANRMVNGIRPEPDIKLSRVRRGDQLILPAADSHYLLLIGYPDPDSMLSARPTIIDIWQTHSDTDQVEIYGVAESEVQPGFSEQADRAPSDPVPYLDRAGSAVNGAVIGFECLRPGERLVWISDKTDSTPAAMKVFEAADWCQLVCRSWKPSTIWNILTDDPSPAAIALGRTALALPPPREFTPYEEVSKRLERQRPTPRETWLPQLGAKGRTSTSHSGEKAHQTPGSSPRRSLT